MSGRKVAVVTGSNKGIGFAIVRALCKQLSGGGDVYLTSRDVGRGQQAVKDLEGEGLTPRFHQLDITDADSVMALKDFLLKEYGGLDILVNNAGIAYNMSSTAPFGEQCEVSVATNYYGTKRACDILFPILRSHARVVNVSSLGSQMAYRRCSDENKQRIRATKTMDDVDQIMTEFVAAGQNGTLQEKGWPDNAYGISKVGVSCLTFVKQTEIDQDSSREDIVVNCCCPGYVDTDMSSHKGSLTIDEGAVTPTYLALLQPNESEVRGKFVSNKKVVGWE